MISYNACTHAITRGEFAAAESGDRGAEMQMVKGNLEVCLRTGRGFLLPFPHLLVEVSVLFIYFEDEKVCLCAPKVLPPWRPHFVASG